MKSLAVLLSLLLGMMVVPANAVAIPDHVEVSDAYGEARFPSYYHHYGRIRGVCKDDYGKVTGWFTGYLFKDGYLKGTGVTFEGGAFPIHGYWDEKDFYAEGWFRDDYHTRFDVEIHGKFGYPHYHRVPWEGEWKKERKD